jgi:hypothetical protein
MGWIRLGASRSVPPNKPLKQSAAPRRDRDRLPLARGEVPRTRSSPPDALRFADAAAA